MAAEPTRHRAIAHEPQRPTIQEDAATLRGRIGGPIRLAVALVVGFTATFAVWGTFAPLASGAVAHGIISPDGSTRTVEHYEGGMIGELLVRDGDTVAEGDPLLILQDVQPRAVHEMLTHEHFAALVTRERLDAEQNGAPFEPSEEVRRAAEEDAAIATMLQAQRNLFDARKRSHRLRRRVLSQRIDQLAEQAKGYAAQVESADRQLALIAEEVAGKEALRRKQIIAKPELLRLQRMQAELEGDRGEYLAEMARAKQQIGETEFELLKLDAERSDEIAAELVAVRERLSGLRERLAASEDILRRTVITAPVSGTVHHLRHATVGGVVHKGEPILNIVPADDPLVIDARVAPDDIDVVSAGLRAKVHLSAFSMRTTPRIDGTVRSVSPDRIVDEVSGDAYFLARVVVDRDAIREIDPKLQLTAGMSADVLIVTGERTMAQYLFQPFMQMFSRSFREA